ncbi:hypothetical protein H310_15223 [Aphanomyces invadans]|uniref:Uncharacterized protein n=1 Tax=Aphanomyces invadans TaxID=157072 RepID=A0A024T7W0_9STRA|nr:hypothetical protein H310_15223 [Aphanomyces invadans]ETV89934.1 hypothetical protein H310_15223 [Aphanomyces invadans]|eukprot:XP_008881433.1 hypothetical protein H310_15223 [Aphanomyces invadans]
MGLIRDGGCSVYFDPVKLAAPLHVEELVTFDSTRLLLWFDDALSDWENSDLGQAMISSATTGPFAANFSAMIKARKYTPHDFYPLRRFDFIAHQETHISSEDFHDCSQLIQD